MPRFVILALLYSGVADPAAMPSSIRFEEIAAKAGLRFELRNAAAGDFHQIELTGGGVAVLDYDNDGCTDIFFTNGAAIPSLRKTGPEFSNRLFRNRCDMSFTDVTAQAGLPGEGYSMAAAADFDNDGFADLFVTGVKGNFLYRNLGNGRFADITARAGLASADPKWAVSAGWLDYDNDGWLDLFVSNYVVWNAANAPRCGTPERQYYGNPNAYQGLPDQLFHNKRDGTFRDVSVSSGIGRHIGKGMGVAFADMDGDGLTDIFVPNDSVRSFLFHNQGGGKFAETGLEAGVAFREDGYAIAGMGSDFRDFDNDGWKDLFFALSHLAQLDRYLGRDSALANRVFRNVEGRRVEDVSTGAGIGFQGAAPHRGAAFADFDTDGRLDAVVTAVNGPAKLFRNITGGESHWLASRLQGRRANRQGLGANVRVHLPDGRDLYNDATTAVGYASASEPLVRFGLGSNRVAEIVEIRWPAGNVQRLSNVAVDRIVEVVEEARP